MVVKLDRFGRIVIPKTVRTRLHWEAGCELIIEEKENEVLLKSADSEPTVCREGSVLVYTGEAVDDLLDATQTVRERRMRDLSWPG